MFQEIRSELHNLLSTVEGLKTIEDYADQLEENKGFVKRTPAVLIPAISGQFERLSTAQFYNVFAHTSLFLFVYNRQGQDKLITEAETLLNSILNALIQDYRIDIQEVVAVEAMAPLLVYDIRIIYKPQRFGE